MVIANQDVPCPLPQKFPQLQQSRHVYQIELLNGIVRPEDERCVFFAEIPVDNCIALHEQ